MSQPTNDFESFMQAVQEIGKNDYGKPSKTYPRSVSMQKMIADTPPNSVIDNGSKAIRAWYNAKNLKKRRN